MRAFCTILLTLVSVYTQGQVVSLTEIQTTTEATGISPYAGQTVQTTGIVTSSAEPDNMGYVFIQEQDATQWGGIMLTGSMELADLRIGDRVLVQGTVFENFGFTELTSITELIVTDSNLAVTPIALDPGYFSNSSLLELEKYESMYVQLENGTDSIYIVNPDLGFGDYMIGTDTSNGSNGCRVLAGRQSSTTFSSLNVSYVSDSLYATNSGMMNVPVIVVQTGDAFTSVRGIVAYSYSDFRLLPRNNADFGDVLTSMVGIGTIDISIYPNPTHGNVSIALNSKDRTLIQVTDISGSNVLSKLMPTSNRMEMNLQQLPAGIYFLQAITEEQTTMEKLIKY